VYVWVEQKAKECMSTVFASGKRASESELPQGLGRQHEGNHGMTRINCILIQLRNGLSGQKTHKNIDSSSASKTLDHEHGVHRTMVMVM
jgi:hypothetical protein